MQFILGTSPVLLYIKRHPPSSTVMTPESEGFLGDPEPVSRS
jgi:hypothetical protein